MPVKEMGTETVLAEKVMDILDKIKKNNTATEDTADLYVQLGETLNALLEVRTARYGGRGSQGHIEEAVSAKKD
jgi:hypothetical protein